MDVFEYTVDIENGEYVFDVGGIPVTTLITRSRKLPVPNGSDQVQWYFASTLPGTIEDYVIQATVQNLSDSFPVDLIARVASFNTSQVTIKLNANVETANYFVNITVTPYWDPVTS